MQDPICIFEPGKVCPNAIDDLRNLLRSVFQRKVVMISIAGRFRQGKSFIMNFVIKYLRAGGATDWMESGAEDTLKGFAWKNRKDPVTRGVIIWPEIFTLKNSQGEEIVVLLVDTQGVFDTNTTLEDSTSIFSLSVLLSSFQIFNIKQHFQGDDMSNLQLFTEFGRLIYSDKSRKISRSSHKPFQELIFLVRDWGFPKDNSYGWEGGEEVLQEVLKNGSSKAELVSQRATITSCFDSLRCFLMPYPGNAVAYSDEFRGKLTDIEDDFKIHLKNFIEDIFRPSNLKTKRVNGKEVTIRELLLNMEAYVDVLRSGKLPKAETLYNATVRATNSAVVNNSFELYQESIRVLFVEPKNPLHFESYHENVIDAVFSHFDDAVKMGGDSAIAAARRELQKRLDESKKCSLLINTAVWDRKRVEVQFREALEEQTELRTLYHRLSDDTGELARKLSAAEKRTEELAKELKDKEKEVENAKSTWKKMVDWFVELINWLG